MNKKLLLTIHLFLFSCYTIYAQAPSWQWGIRGGSAETYGSGPDESVVDMATDQHGNIYVLSYVLQTALNVDGHSITGYGGQDILISSFKCDGTYRWAKDIGSNSTEYPIALKTDTLGGVYVTGSLFCDAVTDHISTDSSWAGSSFQTLFLLKYDTAGNYKWFRMPEPDTLTIWSTGSYANDMDVDDSGNSFMLCNLQPGAFAGGAYIVGTPGNYILKYDRNGNFISGNSMQITGNAQLKMKKDVQLGRYYITGDLQGSLSFGTFAITNSIFIGCFNNSGTFLWQRQNNFDHGDLTPRAAVDNEHNIYIVGTADVTDTFNGYGMVNAVNVGPLIAKLDTNGSNIWDKNATTNAATFVFANPILSNNATDINIAGQYPGLLKWAGYADSLNLLSGSGYQIFVSRFNAATNSVLGLDSLVGTTGLNCDATAMASDNFGNFYVGGDFPNQITVNGTTLTSIGGGSDFFMAKYGTANCECVLPTASFTHTGTHTVTFTYTGSATYDSVRWNFGDGGTSTTVSPTHTYTTSGTYTACIIVYGTCGNDTACQTVTATGTTGIAGTSENIISIYPNPATEELNITGVSEVSAYSIYNITGAAMQQGKLNPGNNKVPMSGYSPGMYILDITGQDGSRLITRIVKQ